MWKWILTIIGFMAYRFVGSVIGFMIGSRIDYNKNKVKTTSGKFGRGFQMPNSPRYKKQKPIDFEIKLLSLASLVIKSDGEVNASELDYVRRYFVKSYGKEKANETFRTFNDVIKSQKVNKQELASLIKDHTEYHSRLQILHFLFSIANSDGQISKAELTLIIDIGNIFEIYYKDFESIRAMFAEVEKPESAYTILELEPDADITEIKKAYRTMVKKYHPDKLQHLPEHLIKGAEEKFRSVQKAYEQLQKEKGF